MQNYKKIVIKLSYAKARSAFALGEAIHISLSRVVYFFTMYVCMYLYSQNLLSLTIRDLKMLDRSGFQQNIDLGSVLSKFISDFENPSRKTRDCNYKHHKGCLRKL